jgi:ribosomal-protein-alanine N-acetyltransferase
MAAVRLDAIGLPELTIRSMDDADIPEVVRIERASYAFPWTEGIFRDCLRVNYYCRVVEVAAVIVGHGVMSVGAGEAHLLNVCVEEAYRCRGIGARLLKHLLRAAATAGCISLSASGRSACVAATTRRSAGVRTPSC